MSETILQINHLSKSFGSHKVLRDIDFTVEKGDVTSIIGASGSGKSTLLRCINQLETPSSGEILYHGTEITGPKVNAAAYRSHVGMVFRRVWGRMTDIMACTWVMPMALAPSVWPGSTDRMPPRTVSAM